MSADFAGLKSLAEEGLAMLGVGDGFYLVGEQDLTVEIGLKIVSPDWQKRSGREFRLDQCQALGSTLVFRFGLGAVIDS